MEVNVLNGNLHGIIMLWLFNPFPSKSQLVVYACALEKKQEHFLPSPSSLTFLKDEFSFSHLIIFFLQHHHHAVHLLCTNPIAVSSLPFSSVMPVDVWILFTVTVILHGNYTSSSQPCVSSSASSQQSVRMISNFVCVCARVRVQYVRTSNLSMSLNKQQPQ